MPTFSQNCLLLRGAIFIALYIMMLDTSTSYKWQPKILPHLGTLPHRPPPPKTCTHTVCSCQHHLTSTMLWTASICCQSTQLETAIAPLVFQGPGVREALSIYWSRNRNLKDWESALSRLSGTRTSKEPASAFWPQSKLKVWSDAAALPWKQCRSLHRAWQ